MCDNHQGVAAARSPGRVRRRPWRGARVMGTAGVVAALCLLSAACTSVRSELGTTNGPCFVALPAAKAAVRGHGKLVGVRLVGLSEIHHTPRLYRPVLSSSLVPRQRLCLVAFGGRFRRSEVRRPAGRPHGRFAIVVLTYPQDRFVVTIVAHRAPTHFGHTHLAG